MAIMGRMIRGDWGWVGSGILRYEISRIPDPVRRERLRTIVQGAPIEWVPISSIDQEQAVALQKSGFKAIDALHVVCAQAVACDILLTTDDRMVAMGKRAKDLLTTRIENPVVWFDEVSRLQ